MIGEALIAYLTDLLPTAGVYYAGADNNDELPFVTVSLSAQDSEWVIDRRGITQCEFELIFTGATAKQAIDLSDDAKAELDNFKGDMGGMNITLARFINEYDINESSTGCFMRVVTLIINYTI